MGFRWTGGVSRSWDLHPQVPHVNPDVMDAIDAVMFGPIGSCFIKLVVEYFDITDAARGKRKAKLDR